MLFYEAANKCFLVFLNPNHKSTFNQTSFQKQKVIPQLLHTLHNRIKTIVRITFKVNEKPEKDREWTRNEVVFQGLNSGDLRLLFNRDLSCLIFHIYFPNIHSNNSTFQFQFKVDLKARERERERSVPFIWERRVFMYCKYSSIVCDF